MSKWVETKVEILGKSTTLKYLINEYTRLTIPRTATDMDGTLTLIFEKSETSRDIKKYF